ncbi:MAG: SEL1-like repeat protein [Lachnospiraceae bacterium]|nr:SEL1-like repeat protein [Lachnospiraceae bacterium]
MNHILEKYQIDPDLSRDEQLALLEKVKQKLLRKLNHVFGDPEKEEELNREMDELEKAMDALRADGGTMSLDDVDLELRGLSQTALAPGQKKELEIQEKERRLLEDELTLSEKYSLVIDLAVYYLQNRIFDKYGYWCQYGAQLGIGYFMSLMYQYHTEKFLGAEDPQKAFYWLKKAAEAGEKDCCEELGKRYLQQKSPLFDLKQAAIWSVKAADEEHPDAYLRAFTAFQMMKDYARAEICLTAGHDNGVPGAAYRMALIYDTEDNKTGERQVDVAKHWYEKAYVEAPDGNICYGLGMIYMELDETDTGIELLMQGYNEFGSEECLEVLQELVAESQDD